MRLSKRMITIFIAVLLTVFPLVAANEFHFSLNPEESQTYRFGFSKEPMDNMNTIPSPLSEDYLFGETIMDFDENGNPVYYATTSDIYVYWRMVSKDWVKLSLKSTQLVNINDSADTIGWTMKVLGTWGEGNDSSLSTDLSGGWTVDDGTKRIHSNEGSSTCWGCVRFECTTAKVSDKSGSYDAILTLILEDNS